MPISKSTFESLNLRIYMLFAFKSELFEKGLTLILKPEVNSICCMKYMVLFTFQQIYFIVYILLNEPVINEIIFKESIQNFMDFNIIDVCQKF